MSVIKSVHINIFVYILLTISLESTCDSVIPTVDSQVYEDDNSTQIATPRVENITSSTMSSPTTSSPTTSSPTTSTPTTSSPTTSTPTTSTPTTSSPVNNYETFTSEPSTSDVIEETEEDLQSVNSTTNDPEDSSRNPPDSTTETNDVSGNDEMTSTESTTADIQRLSTTEGESHVTTKSQKLNPNDFLLRQLETFNQSLESHYTSTRHQLESFIKDTRRQLRADLEPITKQLRLSEDLLFQAQLLLNKMQQELIKERRAVVNFERRVALLETQLENLDLRRDLERCRKTAGDAFQDAMIENLQLRLNALELFKGDETRDRTKIWKKVNYNSKILNDNNYITNNLVVDMRVFKSTDESNKRVKKTVQLLVKYLPTDCSKVSNEVKETSTLLIRPSTAPFPTEVTCIYRSEGQEAWTVIQSRFDGSASFYHFWKEYSIGFGEPDGGEYWLGNNNIHLLTSENDRQIRLRIEMWTESEFFWAEYSSFRVDSEKNQYRIWIDGYRGNATDSFGRSNGQPFSTQDRDQDNSVENCALKTESGWWSNQCTYTSLNGVFRQSVWWYHLERKQYLRPLKTRMMISDYKPPPPTTIQFLASTEVTVESPLATVLPTFDISASNDTDEIREENKVNETSELDSTESTAEIDLANETSTSLGQQDGELSDNAYDNASAIPSETRNNSERYTTEASYEDELEENKATNMYYADKPDLTTMDSALKVSEQSPQMKRQSTPSTSTSSPPKSSVDSTGLSTEEEQTESTTNINDKL